MTKVSKERKCKMATEDYRELLKKHKRLTVFLRSPNLRPEVREAYTKERREVSLKMLKLIREKKA